MRNTETIINIIFDPARGRLSVSSREAELGKPLGTLPGPARTGYDFAGWYLGEERITASTVLTEEEDIRLGARWTKQEGNRRATQLQTQKTLVNLLNTA